MTFQNFVERYKEDRRNRIKDSTWESKDHIIRTKLLPYFGRLKMSSITPQQIIRWQNELINYRDKNGKPYSPVYLKTIQNQLSAIFNHAVRYYNLKENPCVKAGSMGKKKSREMLFWTKDEYLKFIDAMMDKPLFFYAFEMLYWCGIREGDDDDKIRLNQRKPSKYKGLRRFGPEKNLQRINKFMKKGLSFIKTLFRWKKIFAFIWDAFTVSRKWWYYNLIAKTGPN